MPRYTSGTKVSPGIHIPGEQSTPFSTCDRSLQTWVNGGERQFNLNGEYNTDHDVFTSEKNLPPDSHQGEGEQKLETRRQDGVR